MATACASARLSRVTRRARADVFVGGCPAQTEAHRALAHLPRHPHDFQDLGGHALPRATRGSGGDRDPQQIQIEDERLAFDSGKTEVRGIRESLTILPERVYGANPAEHSGFQVITAREPPALVGQALGHQGASFPQGDDARHILGAGASFPLLMSAVSTACMVVPKS